MAEKYSDILRLYVPRSIFLAALVITEIRKHFVANFILTIYHCKTKKNWDPPTISMTSIQSWLLNVAPCLPKKKHVFFFTVFVLNGPQSRKIPLSNMMNGSFCLWSMLANIPYTDGMGNRYSWILWFKLCNKDSNHIISFLSTVLWLCLDHFRSMTYFAGRGPMLRNLIAAWGIHHTSKPPLRKKWPKTSKQISSNDGFVSLVSLTHVV